MTVHIPLFIQRFYFLHQLLLDRIMGGMAAIALGMVFWSGSVGAKGRRRRHWESPRSLWLQDWRLRWSIRWGDKRTHLGRGNGLSAVISDAARESHMQIVGPTRSGKSQLLFAIATQDMARKMPVFFMEAKGDRTDFDQFLKAAIRCGREADVRYFNPQDQRSMTFNPIRRVSGQSAIVVAQQIARIIGREPTDKGEGQDYFNGLDYVKILQMAAIFCKTGLEFNLRDCFYYFISGTARQKAFTLCHDPQLVALAKHAFEEKKDVSGITSKILPWTMDYLGDLINTYSPQIKLDECFATGKLVYFAIPVAHLQLMANPLGRMVITNLIDVSSWRQRKFPKDNPASVTLDEFAQFATPSFLSLIETVGSAKLWVTLSHQDRQQLKRVENTNQDAFASGIFTNTSGCKVVFRTPDPDDAEHWSRMVGTYKALEETERVVKGGFSERRTGEVSRRQVEQFKIHPNQMKNLRQGTALVFSPGQQECLVRTARVYPLLGDGVPEIPKVEIAPAEGLNLAEAAQDIAAVKPAKMEDLIG